jgi:hypothetical protein
MSEIVYTDTNRDYPKGYYKGAISVVKVRNAMKKAGYELVNASNSRCNNVLEGSSGFIRDPKSGRLVYFSADASACFNGDKVLYRTAKHDRDYTGGTNRYADFGELGEAVKELFAHPERW